MMVRIAARCLSLFVLFAGAAVAQDGPSLHQYHTGNTVVDNGDSGRRAES